MILKKVTQIALTFCLLLMVAAVAIPNPQQKQYKDRAEYDIITKVYGEADPARKLALLDEWKQKYPETEYNLERARFYLDSYQKTGQDRRGGGCRQGLAGIGPGRLHGKLRNHVVQPLSGKG